MDWLFVVGAAHFNRFSVLDFGQIIRFITTIINFPYSCGRIIDDRGQSLVLVEIQEHTERHDRRPNICDHVQNYSNKVENSSRRRKRPPSPPSLK